MTKFRVSGLRLLCLLLCLVSLTTAILPVSAAQLNTANAPSMTAGFTYTASVYRSATTGGSVIGHMENGTELTILGQTQYFYKIDCYETVGYLPKAQVACKDDVYTISCDVTRKDTQVFTYKTMASAMQLRHSLLRLAKEQIGVPYVYAGSSPRGFDCSGFTSYLYRMHGITLTRRASTQLGDGIIVSREGLQPGDLVFFRYPGEYCAASHVGIYVGEGQMLHAGSAGIGYASIDEGFFGEYYLCARRVINTSTTEVDNLITAAEGALQTRGQIQGLRTAR